MTRLILTKRWQQLLQSSSPDWMKRGAYRYLLRHLCIDMNDIGGTLELLRSVGIESDCVAVEAFLSELVVGIEHTDDILIRRGMATAWSKEDNGLWCSDMEETKNG